MQTGRPPRAARESNRRAGGGFLLPLASCSLPAARNRVIGKNPGIDSVVPLIRKKRAGALRSGPQSPHPCFSIFGGRLIIEPSAGSGLVLSLPAAHHEKRE
jgi:hypothetical protein